MVSRRLREIGWSSLVFGMLFLFQGGLWKAGIVGAHPPVPEKNKPQGAPTSSPTLVTPKPTSQGAPTSSPAFSTPKPGQQQSVLGLLNGFARYIPKGSFLRGKHTISISRGTWMFETEVTQAQYKALMGTLPEKLNFKTCGGTCPVECVTWHQAAAFANALSKKHGLPECFACTGNGESTECTAKDRATYTACKGWRLPTEAEWEHAARAGTTTEVYGKLADIAWYDGNSQDKSHPVAQKKPNPWGLYDIFGNVWEWCFDRYAPLVGGSSVDPIGPSVGPGRLMRGGGWYTDPREITASLRNNNAPISRNFFLGFRLLKNE